MKTYSQFLGVFVLHKRSKSFLKIIHRELLALPMLDPPVNCLRWDEDILDNLNDAIGSNTVFNGHSRETIDLDLDEASIATYIHTEGFVL